MFRETKIGLWMHSKFAVVLDYFANKRGWSWLQVPPDAWKQHYPEMATKIDEIELRLNNLEAKAGTKIIRQKSK